MEAPSAFKESLKMQFNDRLRVRWSNSKHEWQIEEKIARPTGDYSLDDPNDDHLRLRDGYGYVCSVTPGDRMACPKCGNELKVPIYHFAEVKCDYCQVKGRPSSVIVGHFPLNDMLLEHLRKLDPLRGWRDRNVYGNYDEHLEKIADKKIEDMSGIWADAHAQVVGIESVGYTKADKR